MCAVKEGINGCCFPDEVSAVAFVPQRDHPCVVRVMRWWMGRDSLIEGSGEMTGMPPAFFFHVF